MALNLQNREGKIILAMLEEKYRKGGIPPMSSTALRDMGSMIAEMNKRYGLDLKIDEVTEVVNMAMESALKRHIDENKAKLADSKK